MGFDPSIQQGKLASQAELDMQPSGPRSMCCSIQGGLLHAIAHEQDFPQDGFGNRYPLPIESLHQQNQVAIFLH
jgi:hypothetical protein